MQKPYFTSLISSNGKKPFIGFTLLLIVSFFLIIPSYLHAQAFRVVNYGDDLFAVGAGARALGMGSAHVALANDISAAYWNPALLATQTQNRQAAYMHSERFGGVVGYDYAAYAMPIQEGNAVAAISLFRQGVDGIKNTLNAWDVARNLPRPNPENYFSEFSAADWGMLLSYAKVVNERLQVGGNFKMMYSHLGPFANGLGLSIDLGAFYKLPFMDVGVQIQNAPSMMKFWTVDKEELKQLEDFDQDIPSGQNEIVLPAIKVGLAKRIPLRSNDFSLLTAFDTDIRFENRQAYYLNVGRVSFEPHLGAELGYRQLLFMRLGVTDLTQNFGEDWSVSPTIGAGVTIYPVKVDYAFASFSGATADLGYTHRISLIFDF